MDAAEHGSVDRRTRRRAWPSHHPEGALGNRPSAATRFPCSLPQDKHRRQALHWAWSAVRPSPKHVQASRREPSVASMPSESRDQRGVAVVAGAGRAIWSFVPSSQAKAWRMRRSSRRFRCVGQRPSKTRSLCVELPYGWSLKDWAPWIGRGRPPIRSIYFPRFSRIANRMMAPLTIGWMNEETPRRFIPLLMTPMISAPRAVP